MMKKLVLVAISLLVMTSFSYGQTVQQLLDRAVQHYKNNQYAESISILNQAIRLSPTSVELWYNRGQAYYFSGNLDAAIADYTQVISLSPTHLNALFQRGLAYNRKGNNDAAIADYSRGIELAPNDAQFWYNRGIAHADKNSLDSALADYNQALKLNPSYVRALINRGGVYYRKKQYDLAIADLNASIKLEATNAEAWGNRGMCYIALNQIDAAIGDFDQALKVNANYVKAYLDRAIAYNRKKQNDLAIADLNQAIKISPNYVNAYLFRGAIYYDEKKYDLAKTDMQKVLQLSPGNKYATDVLAKIVALPPTANSVASTAPANTAPPNPAPTNLSTTDAFVNHALAQDRAKQYPEAIATATACIAAFPKDGICYAVRGLLTGNVYKRRPMREKLTTGGSPEAKKELEQAITDLTKAIELSPQVAGYYYERANAYLLGTGNSKLAIADLQKAIELKPDYPGAKKTLEQAKSSYADDLRLAANAKYMLALTLRTENKNEEADRSLNEAITLMGSVIENQAGYSLYLDYGTRGRMYRDLKKYDSAIADFTKAMELKPMYGDAYTERAQANVALKQYSLAMADYEKLLSLPDDTDTKYAKERALIGKVDIYRDTGKLDLAIAEYTKLLTAKPDSPRALYSRGIAYFKKGDSKAAEADFQKLFTLVHDPEGWKKDLGKQGIPPYNKLYSPDKPKAK